MKLKRYGFFSELEHGDPDGVSLIGLRDTGRWDANEKPLAVEYLRSGVLLVGCPGVVTDVLAGSDGGEAEAIGSPHVLTDGEWAWPADLAYYVDRYNVPVPDEFLARMRAANWRAPEVKDLQSLEL